jgi:hypothetical protein
MIEHDHRTRNALFFLAVGNARSGSEGAEAYC